MVQQRMGKSLVPGLITMYSTAGAVPLKGFWRSGIKLGNREQAKDIKGFYNCWCRGNFY